MMAGVVLVAFVAAGVIGYHSYANREVRSFEAAEMQKLEPKPTSSAETEDDQPELVAVVDSQMEAAEISRLYDIELKSYSNGVAVYTTDKDPEEVIRMGEEQGYPTLEVNQTYYLDKEN